MQRTGGNELGNNGHVNNSDVGTRGATGPPIFGKSVNPIPTRGGRFCPPFTTDTPKNGNRKRYSEFL